MSQFIQPQGKTGHVLAQLKRWLISYQELFNNLGAYNKENGKEFSDCNWNKQSSTSCKKESDQHHKFIVWPKQKEEGLKYHEYEDSLDYLNMPKNDISFSK